MTGDSRLTSLRKEIETTTSEIISLVGKRLSLVQEVAEEKAKQGIPLVNRDVERHLQQEVVEACNANSLDSKFGLRLLNQLIAESIRVQRQTQTTDSHPTVADIFARARRKDSAGEQILHLEVGEPDFGPPNQATKMLKKSLRKGNVGYTQAQGILPLRSRIADIFTRRHSRNISPDEVIITVGGRLAIFLALSSIVQTGDEVIIIRPSYPAYSKFVTKAGGRPVSLWSSLDESWNPDMDALENLINPTTRAIILNTPSNPTGKVLNEATVEGIVHLANENDLFVISDEVYSKFTRFPHTSILEFPGCTHICVQSFSKTYGMTGFRLGFAISNSETVNAMADLQSLLVTSVPEFVQHSGIGALDSEDDVKQNVEVIESRRRVMTDLLEELPLSFYAPDGGFYLFPRFQNEELNGSEFAERLLVESGVSIVPGAIYGRRYSSFFRIALCQEKQVLIEAAQRIGEMLE
ncbi:MAG: aminotransferase class I/II-fold pyridoxal phosphate-dependent enzyme [Candidatus Thorarchaeota archaeon]